MPAERSSPSSRIYPLLWGGGMILGIVAATVPGGLILLSLLLPVPLVGLFLDRSPNKRATKAALTAGLAAGVWPFWAFWEQDLSVDAAITLVRQPTMILPCWIAVLSGWLLSETIHGAMRLQMRWRIAAERRRLDQELAALEEQWG
ncbi:hypothetical protein [Rhizosaccharibacter radicis]|uniref:Uncharacterized protein n=1 Tax=Rhizosaccharibacter radicis TaxID=2782605 RepID=A0ABT1VYG8_9PROT|nr:hypothetical protein [Acetobacteraceae bacterium KSS12]